MNNRLKITETEAEQINLRSDEVKEIMGQIPNRIIRYGITVIALIIVAIFIFAFFFKYPDVITGRFYLQTAHPPAFMLARSSGKIQSLLVSEAEAVNEGALLSVIENATSLTAYQHLKQFLLQNEIPQGSALVKPDMVSFQALGELQAPYANFKKAVEDYLSFLEIDYHAQKQEAVQRKIKDLAYHIGLQQQQVAASRANYGIARQVFMRDSLLFRDRTIAAVEYENAQKELVNQKMALTNAEIALSNTQMALSELQQQILELTLNEQQQSQSLQSALNQSFDQLKGAVAEWEKRYCLISPIDGKVAFSGIWEENQNVSAGQHVMTVLPFRKSQMVSKVMIPVNRSGKVKVHQAVNLKFIDFPSNEYGMVVAQLNAISAVPDSAYVGTVFLSDSLVTNYGKVLPFKQNMQGIAEIITEDISLAERLIYPIRAIYKQHVE